MATIAYPKLMVLLLISLPSMRGVKENKKVGIIEFILVVARAKGCNIQRIGQRSVVEMHEGSAPPPLMHPKACLFVTAAHFFPHYQLQTTICKEM